MRQGKVVNIMDFVIRVEGIFDAKFYEAVSLNNEYRGYVASVFDDHVLVVFCDKIPNARVGDFVTFLDENFSSEMALDNIGKLIDPLGNPLLEVDAEVKNTKVSIPIEKAVVPIIERGAVNRPITTGISGIDMVFPIGRGQRQLIIGDKQTGKTQICLDAIMNQKGQNMICIYVGIGKTKKEIIDINKNLRKAGALDYTVMIAALNDSTSAMMFIAPYVAASIAEIYMDLGLDVMVIMDDLKRHADAYREFTLLMGKMPGREAYPAEIFYIHSRLLERGCQLKDDGGSITMLPIIETKAGDISDYISTNVISITDGQIVLSKDSFDAGQKPALSYTLSVSRLGGAVQRDGIKAVGNVIRTKVARYLDQKETFAMSNPEDLTPEIRKSLAEGKSILEDLVQEANAPRSEDLTIKIFKKYID